MKAEAKAMEMLTSDGLNVYDVGQSIGQCKEPFVVVHCYGNYQSVESTRLGYTLLLVHCYVPLDGTQTASLSILVDRVKRVMRGMIRQAIPTGREEPDMIEQDYRALSRTLEYQILKKI
ncbi:MAG: hypothetical protein RSC06_07030 [Clostridia bacterium]